MQAGQAMIIAAQLSMMQSRAASAALSNHRRNGLFSTWIGSYRRWQQPLDRTQAKP
jgi:hypothetical protein